MAAYALVGEDGQHGGNHLAGAGHAFGTALTLRRAQGGVGQHGAPCLLQIAPHAVVAQHVSVQAHLRQQVVLVAAHHLAPYGIADFHLVLDGVGRIGPHVAVGQYHRLIGYLYRHGKRHAVDQDVVGAAGHHQRVVEVDAVEQGAVERRPAEGCDVGAVGRRPLLRRPGKLLLHGIVHYGFGEAGLRVGLGQLHLLRREAMAAGIPLQAVGHELPQRVGLGRGLCGRAFKPAQAEAREVEVRPQPSRHVAAAAAQVVAAVLSVVALAQGDVDGLAGDSIDLHP